MKKKSLLLCSVVLVALGANAQNSSTPRVQKLNQHTANLRLFAGKSAVETTPNTAVKASTPLPAHTANRSNVLNKKEIGASLNFFTLLVSQSNAIDVKPGISSISFTHRQTGVAPESGNNVRAAVSKDMGATWTKTPAIASGPNNMGFRYPQGAIIPKPGSTNAADALMSITGPYTNISAAGWDGNYLASAKLDGSSASQTVLTNGPGVVFQQMVRYGMSSTNDGKVYSAGYDIDYNAGSNDAINQSFKGIVINVGTADFTANKVNWSTKALPYQFMKNSTGNNITQDYGELVWDYNTPGTGYVVAIGAPEGRPDTTYYPMVFKTTDGGNNFTKVAYYDFAMSPGFSNLTAPFNSPLFAYSGPMDLSVDKNGNLHIVTTVNPYNLATGQLQNTTFIYDAILSTTGEWKTVKIANLNAKAAAAGELEKYTDLTQDARIQVASTDDGKVIYAWEDTESDSVNIFPDVYTAGYDPAGAGKLVGPVNVTKGSDYEANNFWLYGGNIANKISGVIYRMHMTTSEHSDAGETGGDPSKHSYFYYDFNFNGVGVADTKKATFAVSQNFPNPFSATTQIGVRAETPGMATLAVYNTVGQKVVEQSAFVNGTHAFTVAKAGLTKGVYFYTVSLNGSDVTKKMIVE